jgi:hypothetical protein
MPDPTQRPAGRAELPIVLVTPGARSTGGISAETARIAQRNTARLDLSVTELTPGATLTVVIESSDDGAVWSEAAPSFAAVTVPGATRRYVSDLRPLVRARWSLVGSAPRAAFSLSGRALLSYAGLRDLSAAGLSERATVDADPDVLIEALLRASGDADDYVSRFYRYLPLVRWSDGLRTAVAKLAAWDLITSALGYNPDQGLDAFSKRADEARDKLREIGRTGAAGMVDSAPASEEAEGISVVSEPLRGWQHRWS